MLAKINPRLNRRNCDNNWLSMQPNSLRYKDYKVPCGFGEVNEDNDLHGRGIQIYWNGRIDIGYFKDGELSTGNYISIWSDGLFQVGEIYEKDGEKWRRGTQYDTDGTEIKYDD